MSASDVIISTEGTLGRIHLNRPRAINALTLPMVRHISAALTAFAGNPALCAVLITGAGERGLCAGGDIRALYDHGRDGLGATFLAEEYRLNAQIAHYSKPYIALMDGITMGGGVGISAHGAIRIVTERTRLAMPETGIGFFPDIGATWLLGQAHGEFGTYLGLTGESIGGADAIFAGLADHFMDSRNIPQLIAKLAELPATADIDSVRAVAEALSQNVTPPLAAHRTDIDLAFAFDTVEEIIAALRDSAAVHFAQATLDTLARKSPTSLKVTLRLLRLARNSRTLEDCLQREYDASFAVMRSDEFYKGVRAAVVDKDRNPKWTPSRVEDVSDALVEAYFKHNGPDLF